jgi:4-amino-4-deoxy-L-arabinose transferase-like glycosyltransferase
MKATIQSVLGHLRTLRTFLSWGEGAPLWLAGPAVSLAATLLVAQAKTLRLPIMGEHRWREADTYAVAYNFAHESLDFFHPRMDLTRGRSGITGMEPPVLQFVTGLAMKVFGDAPTVGRVVVWLTGLAGLFALLALTRRARDLGLAIGFLVAFTLSPLALFELRQIQPDGPTVMLAAIAAFFFYRFALEGARRDYGIALVAYAFAVLMKGPGVALAPAMWCFACANRKVTLRQCIARGAGIAVAVLLYVPWYKWAHYLTDAYNGGQANFWLDFSYEGIKTAVSDGDLLHNVFWFIYPVYVTNWVLFPALIVGLPAAFQRKTRLVSSAFLLWLLFGSMFLACFSPRLKSHWYYADLVFVPVAYFVGFGLSEVFRLFASGTSGRGPTVARWAALSVLSTLVLQRLISPVGHLGGETVGATAPHAEASWMTDGHLTALLAILALTFVAVQLLSARWLRVTAVVLLPFAVYIGIDRARHAALEVMRWRAHASEEGTFRMRWMRTLRPLVDRYSTRADLFVVIPADGSIPDDAFYLNLPLRKGWSEGADAVEKNGFAHYTAAGARFFLNFNSHEISSEANLTKIGATSYFRLYCIDPAGCPAIH